MVVYSFYLIVCKVLLTPHVSTPPHVVLHQMIWSVIWRYDNVHDFNHLEQKNIYDHYHFFSHIFQNPQDHPPTINNPGFLHWGQSITNPLLQKSG